MGVESYFLSAGANVSLFPEGMAPSNVNDGARAVQADLRSWYNDPTWIQYGKGDGSYTATYASASSFTIAAADVTDAYHLNRRVKITGSLTGTVYGKISSSSYSDPDTTVNVTLDSGTLQSEALTVWLSAIPATNTSVPGAGGTVGDVIAYNIGTSGATVPLLDGANTWADAQTFSGNGTIGGTLDVTGVVTTTTDTTVGGDLTVAGTASIGGNALTALATASFADTAAAQAGTSTTVAMNPATTADAIATDALLIGDRTSAGTANYTDEVVAKLTGGGLRRQTLATIETLFNEPDYDSGEQPLDAGPVIVNHGLNTKPRRTRWVLTCTSADAGHASGDSISDLAWQTTADSNDGMTVVINSTQIKFLFLSLRAIQPNNTGPTALDLSKWTVRIWAWIGGAAP